MALDIAHYTQGEAFQSEKRTVFAQAWLPIAVRVQLARPGQYVTSSAGGWPMLAVCGADGVVRAFRNTCRHRNMLLVEQDSGMCENLRCRFHGWTYDLSGVFVDAPPAVAPGGDRAQQGLVPIAMRVWRQVVLVNLQADAPADDLGGLDAVWGAQAQAHGHHAGARMMDLGCNWKTLLECMLADDVAAWHWPTLFVRVEGGVSVIDQIVPRTFLRTRVIRHAYLAAPELAAEAPRVLAALDGLKGDAENLQSERALGKLADTSRPRIAALHAKLAAAYARDDAPA